MGNAMYNDKMSCYGNQECGRYECVFVDKCNGNSAGGYACFPFDFRYFMWLIVAIFLTVVLICSSIVVCYLLRAIRVSFRNAINTEGDIIFQNANNVHNLPHPAVYRY